MTANELRIGNIVKVPNHTAIVTDISTNEEGESVRFQLIGADKKLNIGYYLEVCEPIPITEEWLFKFGFELKEVSMRGVKYYGWLNFSFHLDINFIDNTFFYHWMGGNIEIQYIHQLQNLYYALTGEELTLKN